MFTVGAFVCVVSSVVQAQTPPSNYEHLKELGWLIGTWEAESVADEGIPGLLEKGDKISFRLSCDWRLNKNVIGVEYTMKANGTTVLTHNGMIGWDTANEQIISGGFDSLGGHGHSVWSRDGDNWRFKSSGVRGDAKRTSGTTVISDIGDDTMTGQTTERKQDGDDLPDDSKIVWKRVN